MSRWNELKYSLALNILFPRFCLFVLLPCFILVFVPAPSGIPWLVFVLRPGYALGVLIGCLLLFGLEVAANLCISRYLRLHQTENSPYVYKAGWDPGRRSNYFRIHILDKPAFRVLLRDLRREYPGEAIRLWLWLDDLLLVPPLLVISAFLFVFMFVPWLVRLLWVRLKARRPSPT